MPTTANHKSRPDTPLRHVVRTCILTAIVTGLSAVMIYFVWVAYVASLPKRPRTAEGRIALCDWRRQSVITAMMVADTHRTQEGGSFTDIHEWLALAKSTCMSPDLLQCPNCNSQFSVNPDLNAWRAAFQARDAEGTMLVVCTCSACAENGECRGIGTLHRVREFSQHDRPEWVRSSP